MKDTRIWLLTAKGIFTENGEPLAGSPFDSRSVTFGTSAHDRIVVIVDSHEIWEYRAGSWAKAGVSETILNCAVATTPDTILLGTAGARLAQLDTSGITFLSSFDDVPERSLWDTPWGGPPDVRSLAVSADGVIYANVHVGWICRSRDGGVTWTCLTEGLEKDVHQVGTHPDNPSVVLAATATGFHMSHDYGESFSRLTDPMPYHYQRACVAFPGSDMLLCTTSRGPHGQADALLYGSADPAASWNRVADLPDGISQNLDTHQLVTGPDGCAWICVENKQLWHTSDYGKSWNHVLDARRQVNGLLKL